MKLDITPLAKPRMTQRDKWKKRPSVLRYRAFKDEWRLKVPSGFDLNACGFLFVMPMPKSWSKKKKADMDGVGHTQKPDLDNILKAVFDAHLSDDSGIHTIMYVRKQWGYTGEISVLQYEDNAWVS